MLIRILIALLGVVSVVALANELFFFVDGGRPCQQYFEGAEWGTVVVWTVMRFVSNFISIFYCLYIFWFRPLPEQPCKLPMSDSDSESNESMQPLNRKKPADEDMDPSDASLELSPRNSQSEAE